MFQKMWTDGLFGLPEYLNEYQLKNGCFDDDGGGNGGGGEPSGAAGGVESFEAFSAPAGTVEGFDASRGPSADAFGGDDASWGPPPEYTPAPLPTPEYDTGQAFTIGSGSGYDPSSGFLGTDPAGYPTPGINPYQGVGDLTADLGDLYGGPEGGALGGGTPIVGAERESIFGDDRGDGIQDRRRYARATTYLQRPFQKTAGSLTPPSITSWAEWGARRT